jgi:hypothetical protein
MFERHKWGQEEEVKGCPAECRRIQIREKMGSKEDHEHA